MKTSLDHLPASKQRELGHVVRVLFEEFERRSHCEEIAPDLIAAWPRKDKFSRRCFELLRQAYVNARYSPHYKISDEELGWLGKHVAGLQELVEQVCRQRLA